jgi:hypothetical protein
MNLQVVIATVVALVQAGQTIAGPVETLVKDLIGFLGGGTLTPDEIATAFQQVLAADEVIAATAAAQSGGDQA